MNAQLAISLLATNKQSSASTALINSLLYKNTIGNSDVTKPMELSYDIGGTKCYVMTDKENASELLSRVKSILEELQIVIMPESSLCNNYALTCKKGSNFGLTIYANTKTSPDIYPFLVILNEIREPGTMGDFDIYNIFDDIFDSLNKHFNLFHYDLFGMNKNLVPFKKRQIGGNLTDDDSTKKQKTK